MRWQEMPMPERETAQDQLSRILYTLPAAARPGGVAIDELARALDVPIETVQDDITTVAEREYYHPAGSVDAMSIFVDGNRIRVVSKQGFDRPVRLSEPEALALGLGLRAMASEAEGERRLEILKLAKHLEDTLTAPSIGELMPGDSPPTPAVEYDPEHDLSFTVATGDDGFRGVMTDAASEQRWCSISYLKPGEAAPERRRIAPYQLVYADGAWYTLAHDAGRCAVRTFRMDRVLDVDVEDGTFQKPDDFDVGAYVAEHGAPYMAMHESDVAVRYAPSIARWILERGGDGAATAKDGSVVVHHRVADRRWIVRHVLQYAGDAVVETPDPVRSAVADAARRIVLRSS
jgi:proteasome accessory factor C